MSHLRATRLTRDPDRVAHQS